MNKNIRGLLFTIVMTFVLMSIFSCGGAGLEWGNWEEPTGSAEIHTVRKFWGDYVNIYGYYQGCPVWYYYDGMFKEGAYYHHNNEKRFRITQVADKDRSDSISYFKIEGNFAVWSFWDGMFHEKAYYYKDLSKPTSSINQITQVADGDRDDNISNFKIENGQASWRFYDGMRKVATWHTKNLN